MFSNSYSQAYTIDSTFTEDAIIYPFGPNDTIYGIGVTGDIELFSDTSLVRIIFVDVNQNEYLLYESYPFIVGEYNFQITNESDETKFLNETTPYYIEIQIVNARIGLSALPFLNTMSENSDSLQTSHKENVENMKVIQMNSHIQANEMIWIADNTSVSQLPYSKKKTLLGNKYNLLGLDYYVCGVFDPTPGVGTYEFSNYVEEFDWRNRHGANNPNKSNYYYVAGREGEGWMTSVKDQNIRDNCIGLCYIYAPVSVVEGLYNIYYNCYEDAFGLNYYDIDLSEQHILECDGFIDNECNGGPSSAANNMLLNSGPGVVDEICFPIPSSNPDPPYFCNNPPLPSTCKNHIFTPDGCLYVSLYPPHTIDEKKAAIINRGPLLSLLPSYSSGDSHFIAIVGFGTLKVGDVFNKDPYTTTLPLTEDSPYVGKQYWIFKNSWGTGYGQNGYMYHIHDNYNPGHCKYYPSVVDNNNSSLEPSCFDMDKDGYCNWGISVEQPTTCSELTCNEKRDSDDSDPRIGPFDDNFYGIPVQPIMRIVCDGQVVSNGGFYLFYDDPNPVARSFNIAIENNGNAQLNLVNDDVNPQIAKISFSGPSASHFSISNDPPTAVAIEDDTLSYYEPYILPQTGLKTENIQKKLIVKTDNENCFKIFPNPARQYTIAEQKVELNGEIIFNFYNGLGNIIHSLKLQGEDYNIIDLRHLPTGLYLLKIFNNESFIESHKLIIAK